MVVTEMVSAIGLTQGAAKTMKLLRSSPGERPLSVQIFGRDPDWMARGAAAAEEMGADIIDINMGCPARKVIRHGSGAALLKDFRLIESILKRVRRVVRGPLTVKTRAGWRPGEGGVLDLAPILADCGVDAVTLHGRFGIQGFGGRADWEIIARLVECFPGPVIGNGDVTRPEDVPAMLASTGCAGVMIGRAALGNPWIFRQALALLDGRPAAPPDLDARLLAAGSHARMLAELVGYDSAVYKLRSVLMWYTKGLDGSSAFRRTINQIRDFDLLMRMLEEYFRSLASGDAREAEAV